MTHRYTSTGKEVLCNGVHNPDRIADAFHAGWNAAIHSHDVGDGWLDERADEAYDKFRKEQYI